jgi:hypothetical protein
MKKDAAILAELRRLEAESPEATDLIYRTAKNLDIKVDAVMDALERDVPKPPSEVEGLRAELFSDVASQFERMEQPLSLAWMQNRNVSLEELHALSGKIALILRGYMALSPADRIAFVTSGVFARQGPGVPVGETVLGARHSDAANHETEPR